MTDADSDRSLDLAIVGMAGRFPGARNVEALWDLLIGGREGITRFSDDELLANGVSPATLTDPAYVRAAASLDDVDRFDAAFFGIPAEYAQVLDPQQRVFLEEAWHAFEDAGYVARSFDGLVGVYAGADMSTYMFNNVIVRGDVVASMDPLLIGLANDKDSLATRVGYMFDLRGPCFSIQSYCSTSLVAVCTAATGLLNGECDLALAGGISIGLPDDVGYVYEDNGMKSPDGRCRAFDADAEGTPMGSGVGIVVLRRLDDALRDGDSIRAVLRGWAVTNDGGLKVGYTAPGVRGQAAAITEAIAAARIDSTSIDYIEAHGSGTPLGDSVEIASLQRVFGEGHNVAIGSVKTNIGHLNHASGVTGLIKTVLSLEHGVIPKTLHFNEPNPQLLNPPSLHVVSEATPWPATDHPPRAGVSSFGIGGTNAHVIVERAPEAPRDPAPRRHHLLAWSARSAAALDELTDALATHVGSLGDADVIDTSFTLLAGREHFQHRRCLVTSSAAGAAELLGSADRRGTLARVEPMSNRPTALLIAGVGEQYEGMAADLYATEPLFRSRLDEYRAALRDMIGTDPVAPFVDTRSGPPAKPDLRALMGRGDGAAAAETSAATETLQPALFVVWHSLCDLWLDWGLEPTTLLGYSLGEYVAASVSGMLSFDDALALVVHRARLIGRQPPGAMCAFGTSEDAVRSAISDLALPVDIAGVNGPQIAVAAGPPDDIAALIAELEGRGVVGRRLDTTHAFHSSMLRPIAAELSDWIRSNVSLRPPEIALISNVTGGVLTDEEATDPSYWARHMCEPVRFADGLATTLARPDVAVVEIGPGNSLAAMARTHPSCDRDRWPLIVSTLPAFGDRRPSDLAVTEAVARLWLGGVRIDPVTYFAGQGHRRARLPRYPFSRDRHWLDVGAPMAEGTGGSGPATSRASTGPGPWLGEPVWELVGPVNEPSVTGDVVIFADERGVGDELARRLRGAGTAVTLIRRGDQLDQADDGWVLDPMSAADHDDVLRECLDGAATVVHLWSLDAVDVESMQTLGFLSVAAAAKALGTAPGDGFRLIVVTSDGDAVAPGDVPRPEAALVVGPTIAASQEYPGLATQRVDLRSGDGSEWVAACTEALIPELDDRARSAPLVAVRDGERFTRRFEVVEPGRPVPRAIRRRGTYLLTGATGTIGLHLVEHFVRAGAGAVVVTSRTGLPDQNEWSAIVEGEPTSAAARLITRIEEIEALGATVVVERADVSSAPAMKAVLDRTRARFGRIDGVLHLASSNDPEGYASLAVIDRAAMSVQFAPKVQGALVLETLLADEPLDFCVLFSSISAVLGGLGYASYASANAFLDGLVHRNREQGRPWMSIAWDTWAPTTEMFAADGFGASQVEYSFSVADGLVMLDGALSRRAANALVGTGDLEARLSAWGFVGDDEDMPTPVDRRSRPELPQEYVPPASPLERRLAAAWTDVLGVEPIGTMDNFFDLGGTSLMGLQLLRTIRRSIGVSIPAVALFEAPTVLDLAIYLGDVDLPDEEEVAGPGSGPAPGESAAEPVVESSAAPVIEPIVVQPIADPAPEMVAVVAAPDGQSNGAPTPQRPAAPAGDIAIVGMAGRFPGAASVGALWEKLLAGEEAIRFFSDEDLIAAGVDPLELQDPNYVRARPVLDDIRSFDASLFGYSPADAALTDPQQRLFLECCWEALDDAGYGSRDRRGGRVGVFAGTGFSTYMMAGAGRPAAEGGDYFQVVIGNEKDALATVASYRLDLTGPSMSVQTFCSTSLVAVHLGRQSLRNRECDLCLAGGVSIRVPDLVGYHFQPGGQESPDGHVRTFDANAAGTLFGDGVGVVALKRLDDALADGDHIYAVIRGSAVNNDGARKVGYTAPSVVGQARVIADALADAGASAEQIAFIEAHGSATELGDVIEVAALTRAFDTTRRQYCALGSLKSNLGHLDRAAGVTGLIKGALALYHRVLPPTINIKEPNPDIDLANSPFFLNTEARTLVAPDGPLLGGVSSLGMGGTNAHVVLEAPPDRAPGAADRRRVEVVTVSARTASAADEATRRLGEHLLSHADLRLRDVAWTMQIGRQRFRHRRAAIVTSVSDAAAQLAPAGPPTGAVRTSNEPAQDLPVVFVLGRGGAPERGALRELASREPTVRDLLASVRHPARAAAGGDVVGFLVEDDGAPLSLGAGPSIATAAFLVQLAAATAVRDWGIDPIAAIGADAIGHVVATVITGALSAEEAVAVAANTGDSQRDQSEELATERLGAVAAQQDVVVLLIGADESRAQVREGGCVALVLGPGSDADDVVVATAVADVWLAGGQVGWARNPELGPPVRVSLPAYPFERADHWFDESSPAPTGGAAGKLPRDEWLSTPVWTQAILPRRALTLADWLVLAPADVDLHELVASLPGPASVVRPGAAYSDGPDEFTVRPDEPGDLAAVLTALRAQGRTVSRVLHLWCAPTQVGAVAQEATVGFHTLVSLATAMTDVGIDAWQLDIAVSGAMSVFPDDRPSPVRALCVGPAMVVPLEYPGVDTRIIDVEGLEPNHLEWLLRQLADPDRSQPTVALRGGSRWTRDYARLEPAASDDRSVPFIDGGVYLVTGGLGGIGLAMSERLARDHQCRLVLFGRTGLPPERDWAAQLARDDLDADVRRRIEGVLGIRAAGGAVEVVVGDVTSADDLGRAIAVAIDSFGALDGVLHAAGVPGMGLMQFKSRAEADEVMAPKVLGALALEEALGGRVPDLLVLFSSVTSQTGGGPGLVDYCSANAYLDAYAIDAGARGVAARVVSVSWGEWEWNAWTAGLDSYDDGVRRALEQGRQELGIGFEDGWETLAAAVAAEQPVLVATTQDVGEMVRHSRLFNVDLVRGAASGAQRHPRPEIGVPYIEPRSPLEATIAELWAAALGLERVGVQDRFFELGGNSLVGVSLVARIRNDLQLDALPPHVLYEAPTVESLASYISDGAVDDEDATRRARAARRDAALQRTAAD